MQFLRVPHNLAAAVQQLHPLTDTRKTDNITRDNLADPLASGQAFANSDTSEEALPDKYQYLRNLKYNQSRQPKKGDVVTYSDHDFY